MLLLFTALLAACGSPGPESCRALEACCDALAAGLQTSCRQGVEQARSAEAGEEALDAACQGALSAYRGSGACEAGEPGSESDSGLSLSVTAVGYLPGSALGSERASFFAVIALENAAAGASASLAPPLFTLRLAGGVGVLAEVATELPNPCAADMVVLEGGRASCTLGFRVPPGATPSELSYRSPEGRGARAPIPRCGALAPSGLCAEGELCEEGRCVDPTASPLEPEPEPAPEGCLEPASLSSSCTGCFIEAGCLDAPVQCPDECQDCQQLGTTGERCACQADRCEGCFEPYLECLATRCPGCS